MGSPLYRIAGVSCLPAGDLVAVDTFPGNVCRHNAPAAPSRITGVKMRTTAALGLMIVCATPAAAGPMQEPATRLAVQTVLDGRPVAGCLAAGVEGMAAAQRRESGNLFLLGWGGAPGRHAAACRRSPASTSGTGRTPERRRSRVLPRRPPRAGPHQSGWVGTALAVVLWDAIAAVPTGDTDTGIR